MDFPIYNNVHIRNKIIAVYMKKISTHIIVCIVSHHILLNTTAWGESKSHDVLSIALCIAFELQSSMIYTILFTNLTT